MIILEHIERRDDQGMEDNEDNSGVCVGVRLRGWG